MHKNFTDNEEKVTRLTKVMHECGINKLFESKEKVTEYCQHKIFGNDQNLFENEFDEIDL